MSGAAVREPLAAVPGVEKFHVLDGGNGISQGAAFDAPAASGDIPVMLGIKQVAEKYNLPVHFVREAVKQGLVYSVRAGSKKIYVNEMSVVRWLSGTAGS